MDNPAWLIYFEDRDVPPELYTDEGAEENARARFKVLLQSWSCHLFRAADLEVCLCAAIRMPDGEVVRGHRHDNCYDVVRRRVAYRDVLAGAGSGGKTSESNRLREQIVKAEQGFLTSRNRFVDRREGMALMRASGLRSWHREDGLYRGDGLFSEDLYPNGPTTS